MKGTAPKVPPQEWKLVHDAFTGKKLGKYEIACRISTGGMSEVFLAFQSGAQGFRKYVVLKRILENIRTQPDVVRMFVQEAKITAAFSHSNIAQVFDLDEAEGELFLVMEFIAGATLVEIARSCIEKVEPIPTGLTLAVARDTAFALQYAHHFVDAAGRAQPVIHRDVAEKNIMVTWEGVTKLLDFGIAKRLDIAGKTQIGTVKGTSGYMSPEQIRGEPVDGRSDVFSLGIVLHECLSGQRLFYRKSREEEMYAALHQDVHPPSRRNPEVTPALDAVVLRALSREKQERFATARDFARAIEMASGDLMWEKEKIAQFMQRMFAEQRQHTRDFLSELSPLDVGDLKVSNKMPLPAGGFPTKPSKPPPAAKSFSISHDAPTDYVPATIWDADMAGAQLKATDAPEKTKFLADVGSRNVPLPPSASLKSWKALTEPWLLKLQDRLSTPVGMLVAGLLIGLAMASAVYIVMGFVKP